MRARGLCLGVGGVVAGQEASEAGMATLLGRRELLGFPFSSKCCPWSSRRPGGLVKVELPDTYVCPTCGKRHPRGAKVRHARDYSSQPSVLDRIAACESLEELADLGTAVREQVKSASAGTLKKWKRAVDAKEGELRARRIVTPDRRLVVPQGAGRIVVP